MFSQNRDFADIKNFTQVFLDGELGGSPFEGSRLRITVPFLADFLKWVHAHHQDHPIAKIAYASFRDRPAVLDDLQHLLANIEKLVEVDNGLLSKAKWFSWTIMNNHLGRLSDTIIKEYKANQRVFIPGGWSSDGGGHQMIYSLTEASDGCCLFKVYNTGAGAQYHESIVRSSGKPAFYPIYAFKFDLADKEERLKAWLPELLKPVVGSLIDSKYSYSEKELYETIIQPGRLWLEGEKVPGSQFIDSVIGQRSGTCVYKALMMMVREHFLKPNEALEDKGDNLAASSKEKNLTAKIDKVAYRQFVLSYRLYLLHHILEPQRIKKLEASFPDVHQLIKKGLANTARMLDESIKEPLLLDAAQRHYILGELESWHQQLSKIEFKEVNKRVKLDKAIVNTSVDLILSREWVWSRSGAGFKKQREYPLTGDNLNRDIDQLLAVYAKKSEEVFCGLVEDFCYFYSDMKRDLKPLTFNAPEKLLEKCHTLLDHYFHYRSELTPRSIVVYLSLQCLVDRLAQEKFFCFDFQPEQVVISGLPLYGRQLKKLCEVVRGNPLLGSADARLDEILNRVTAFYRQYGTDQVTNPTDLIAYYCSYIRKASPQELKRIKKRWEKHQKQEELVKLVKDDFPDDFLCGYSYLTRDMDGSVPLLTHLFKLQLSLEAFAWKCLAPVAVNFSKNELSRTNELNIKFKYKKYRILSGWDKDVKLGVAQALRYKNLLLRTELPERFKKMRPEITAALLSFYDNNNYLTPELPWVEGVAHHNYGYRNYLYESGTYSRSSFVPTSLRWQTAVGKGELLSMTPAARLQKKLHFLLSSRECRVVLLLSELRLSSSWLSDPDFQQYILLGIFTPNVLLSALRNTTEIWPLLNRLHYYNRITQDPAYPDASEWFVLTLAAGISHYALSAGQSRIVTLDPESKREALAWLDKLKAATNARLTQSELLLLDQQKNHLWRLQAFQFLPPQNPADWYLLLQSYFFLMLPYQTDHPGYALQQEFQQSIFKNISSLVKAYCASSENQANIIAAAQAVLQGKVGKGLLQPAKAKSVNFPFICLIDEASKSLLIDVESGAVSYDGKSSQCIPLSYLSKPEYKALFGTVPVLCQKQSTGGTTIYTWVHKDENYVLKSEKRNFAIYKSIHGQWYQLAVPHRGLKNQLRFQYAAFDKKSLPALFDQAAYLVWVHNARNYIVFNQYSHEICYVKRSGKLMTANGVSVEFSPRQIPKLLLRLESSRFIETRRSNSQVSWYLPRYQLTFIKEGKSYLTEDGLYTLRVPALGQDYFGSGLILKGQFNSLYLMPLQPYYCLKKKELREKPPVVSIYYQWRHNLDNQIAIKMVDPDFKNKYEEENQKELGWDYENSEQAVQFIWEDNRLVARTGADQIYLAYLYLAQNQCAKAFELLRTVLLQGNFEEIKRLWWIIKKLPDDRYELINSEVIAVQMLALNHIVTLVDKFGSSLYEPVKSKYISKTQEFQSQQIKQLQGFLASLSAEFSNCYSRYDKHRNNIPFDLRLTKAEENILLSRFGISSQAGVLGTRYLEQFSYLRETRLRSAYDQSLEVIKEKSNDAFRMSEFLGDIKEYLPLEIRVDWYSLNLIKRMIKELSPWASPKTLYSNLPYFYELSLRDELTKEQKAKILSFCVTSLNAHRANFNSHAQPQAAYYVAQLLWGWFSKQKPSTISWNGIGKEIRAEGKPWFSKHDYFTVLDRKMISRPFPAIQNKISTIIHTPTDKHSASIVRQTEEKEAANFTWDILQDSSPLRELYQALDRDEDIFSQKRETVLAALPALPSLILDEQNAEFIKLDQELLEAYKQKLAEQRQHCAANGAIQDPHTLQHLETIKSKCMAALAQQEAMVEAMLARRNPQTVEELGLQTARPTIESLMKGIVRHHIDDYRNMGFAVADLDQIQPALKQLFALHQASLRLDHLITALKHYQSMPTDHHAEQLINAVLARDEAKRCHEILFQYIEGIGLYPSQARMLTFLAEQDPQKAISWVLQLIMGGGKTKVILPLLLYLLADGKRLPIVMVPEATLNTNFCDLSETSANVFDQRPILFSFNRDTGNDVDSLGHLYEMLLTVLEQKQYIVTTVPSLQSLQLKYIEVLHGLSQKPRDAGLSNKEHYLSQILGLLKETGVAAIDEVHLLLHIRKELNYSMGKAHPIEPNTIETVAQIYAWLSEAALPPEWGGNFRQLLKNPNPIMDDVSIERLIDYYVKTLAVDQSKQWIQNLLLDQPVTVLQDFILEKLSDFEEAALLEKLSAAPDTKDKWLILRQQFKHLLKSTLRNKLHENYGPDLKNKDQLYAIPYRANNTPTLFTYANFMEAFNYTAQMYYCDGIRYQQFLRILRAWQSEARLSRQVNPDLESLAEQRFNQIFAGENLVLRTLNLKDGSLLPALHQKFFLHPLLVDEIVKEAFESVRLEKLLMRCDSINVPGMFNQVLAISATPNHRVLPPEIGMHYETSLLIESRVKDYLRSKNTPLNKYGFNNPQDFIRAAIESHPNMRVLLDCGSRLLGISNLEVAKEMAKVFAERATLIQQQGQKPLRYILFYQGDSLFALKVEKNPQDPKKLTNTNPDDIARELEGCSLEERATYLDQEHTTGVDILQWGRAVAVLTVDVKTGISSFLQAAMRMRQLSQLQEIEVAVAPEMVPHIQEGSRLDLERLFFFLEKTQLQKFEAEHFSATLKIIANLFRQDLLDRLLHEDNQTKLITLFKAAQPFFIETQTSNIAELFEAKSRKMAAKEIFKLCGNLQLSQWRKALIAYGIKDEPLVISINEMRSANESKEEASEPEEESLTTLCAEKRKILEHYAENGAKICKQAQLYPFAAHDKEVQQQKQKEDQKQKEQERMRLDYGVMRTLREPQLEWIDQEIDKAHIPLNQLMQEYKEEWHYTDCLEATDNFLYVYQGQEDNPPYHSVYMPYATALFFVRAPNDFRLILVSPEEAESLMQALSRGSIPAHRYGLMSLTGHAYKMPALTPDEAIKLKTVLEQAAFFNGRADILTSQPATLWLYDQWDAKLKFLRTTLKPALDISDEQINRLANTMVPLQPQLEAWARNTNSASWQVMTSNEERIRFERIRPQLAVLRTGQEVRTKQLIIAPSGQDEELILQYQAVMRVLWSLKNQEFNQAVQDFAVLESRYGWANKRALQYEELLHHSRQCLPLILDFCVGDEHLKLSSEDALRIADALKLARSDMPLLWARQMLGATCLPLKVVSRFLKAINFTPENLKEILVDLSHQEQLWYVQRYLAVAAESTPSVTSLLDLAEACHLDLDKTIKERNGISALVKLQESKIEEPYFAQAALQFNDFCSMIHLLNDYQQLQAIFLTSILEQVKPANMPKAKTHLNFLAHHQLLNPAYFYLLDKDEPWQTFRELEDIKQDAPVYYKRALDHSSYRLSIEYLSSIKLLNAKHLQALEEKGFSEDIHILRENLTDPKTIGLADILQATQKSTLFSDLLNKLHQYQQENRGQFIQGPILLQLIENKRLDVVNRYLSRLEDKQQLTEAAIKAILNTRVNLALSRLATYGRQDVDTWVEACLNNENFVEALIFAEAHRLPLADIQKVLEQPDLQQALSSLSRLNMDNAAQQLLLRRVLQEEPLRQYCILLHQYKLNDVGNMGALFVEKSSLYSANHLEETVKLMNFLSSLNLLNQANLGRLLDNNAWLALHELFTQQENNPVAIEKALSRPEIILAKKLLANDDHWSAVLEHDNGREFANEIANHYGFLQNTVTPLVSAWTKQAILTINAVRKSYEGLKSYKPYMNSINNFTQDAIQLLLTEDKNLAQPKAKQNIVSSLHRAAGKYFEHRDKVLRYLTDILLTLSVVGLLVLMGRSAMGKSFFFHNASTTREDVFVHAVSRIQPIKVV